jgi:hypothetical protein
LLADMSIPLARVQRRLSASPKAVRDGLTAWQA